MTSTTAACAAFRVPALRCVAGAEASTSRTAVSAPSASPSARAGPRVGTAWMLRSGRRATSAVTSSALKRAGPTTPKPQYSDGPIDRELLRAFHSRVASELGEDPSTRDGRLRRHHARVRAPGVQRADPGRGAGPRRASPAEPPTAMVPRILRAVHRAVPVVVRGEARRGGDADDPAVARGSRAGDRRAGGPARGRQVAAAIQRGGLVVTAASSLTFLLRPTSPPCR